jgi:hypothetical protein
MAKNPSAVRAAAVAGETARHPSRRTPHNEYKNARSA